jgi:ATP-dependent Clp protease ATP-binding subunit ClpB
MNYNIFTHKLSEALQAAHDLALNQKHNTLDEVHFLFAMLAQKDGFVPEILKKLNINPQDIKDNVLLALNEYPRIEGNYQLNISPSFQTLL